MGAHCAGAAGKRTTRGRVQSIVSMDPAGPLFSVGDSANRVHFTDAVHVENIVTDAGNLGFAEPVGHANVSFIALNLIFKMKIIDFPKRNLVLSKLGC